MAELDLLAWDGVLLWLSPQDVTARTSILPFDCAQGILNIVEGLRTTAVSRYLFILVFAKRVSGLSSPLARRREE